MSSARNYHNRDNAPRKQEERNDIITCNETTVMVVWKRILRIPIMHVCLPDVAP